PQSEATTVSHLRGVSAVAPALTLTDLHVSGTVPKQSPDQGGPRVFGGPAGGGTQEGPRSINVDQSSVSGVDTSQPSLALVPPGQVTSGTWFKSGVSRQAVLSESYARRNQLHVGSTLTIGGKTCKGAGIPKP